MVIKLMKLDLTKQSLLIMKFMASSLSNLVDNLTEGIHKIKCKDSGCCLKYENAKSNLMIYKCLSCNGCYSKKLY